MSEFNLIDRYIRHSALPRDDVKLGIGDDAALLQVPAGQLLAVSTDTLVAGVHFPVGTGAQAIGHKALAVNISDMAAMGANPAWATLALTLPEQSANWLAGFMDGFTALAKRYDVALVGGDTTRGPLTITVQIMGHLPVDSGLTRAGASSGDRVFVTGHLGDAALALQLMDGGSQPAELSDENLMALKLRLDRPQPRVDAGVALRDLASSAIDLSDGLLSDLGHIVTASGVGVSICRDRVPRSEHFNHWLARQSAGLDDALAAKLLLNGGDDYELCFTVKPEKIDQLKRLNWDHCGGITEVGIITSAGGVLLVDSAGMELALPESGYDHFK